MTAALVVDRADVGLGLGAEATATFSPCRAYRYALTRRWDNRPPAVFVMLNPSTADAFVVDPTVRRCLGFARSWGAGGLVVLNAFGLRSTNPMALYRHGDPVGPDNDTVIADVLSAAPAGPVVVAWGAHGTLGGRDRRVADLICRLGLATMCLGMTKGGSPRHPLYVRGETALTAWTGDQR